VTCGIYALINASNGKRYVGQSIDIERRWRGHVNELRSNRHGNSHLTNAWRVYGESAFSMEILQICEPNKKTMASAEQFWIDKFDVTNRDKGYNIAPVAASNLGIKRSPEARAKMSAAKLQMTDETKQKLRLANLGKKQSEETKQKRAISCRNPSPEVRAVPDTSEALTAPNEDAPKGFVKLDEFLLAQYVEYLRQYTPEELAKHDITLAEPKDWATELWVDLMDAWNYKSWAQEIRNGFIVDNDQKAIELLRTRFEQMIAERSKRDD
jgi:group I intron endonuclease